MKKQGPKAQAITELMLAVFRLNGRLLERGDALVAPLGINSARWQVMGAVYLAGEPMTAPRIASAMGISRQGAQKTLNRLLDEGLMLQQANPRHERSVLYALSSRGVEAVEAAQARQDAWAERLAAGAVLVDLRQALRVLADLQQELDAEAGADLEGV